MNISALFIRRPIATTLAMASIMLFGLIGYKMLPVSDLPNVDYPMIQVNASLPGANPDTMASAIATPLEKEFCTIAGIDQMSSTSSQGTTSITLQFVLTRDIDAAAQDVQAAIARTLRKLPANMPAPPSYRKVNPTDQPILWLVLTSPDVRMSDLDEIGQTLIAQRVSMIDGVAQVQVFGSQKYAVRIELNPKALAARQIGVDEVADVVGDQYNVNMPLGSLIGPNRLASIQANGQIPVAEPYNQLIIAYRNGQPVRLKDVGRAFDSVENDQTAAWYVTPEKRDRAIILIIQKQPGTNTVDVCDAVKAVLPTLRDKMPASVDLTILRDASTLIRESFNDVQFTLLLTLLLVVLVIFLFLRNLSATIIPSLTLPMSIVGTFAVMYLLGYSLDNLSLMALTLSVGFVVDDAIVMLENCVRHLEMGKERVRAALDASKEIGFTIVSMTLSLAAVFIPVLFLGGIMGRLFREFSVTIGAAVLVSGFVSLTLTPMMCSRFLRNPENVKHGVAYRVTEAGFNGVLAFYNWSLWFVLRHRFATLLVAIGLLVASGFLFVVVPKGFIPNEDRDQLQADMDVAQDASFEETQRHQLQLVDIVQKDPDVTRFMSSSGANPGGGGANKGRMFLILKPKRTREKTADQIIDDLRPRLNAVPGVRTTLINPPVINVSGRQSRALYQLTLFDPDTVELYAYADELEQKMRAMGELTDVISDMQLKNPELDLEIDRDQAFTLGVTPLQIETALYGAYGTQQISTIFTPTNTYQVIMELDKNYQTDPGVLSMLYVRSSKGALVPLKVLAKQTESVGPLQINHTGQLPSVTISFNCRPGVSIGDAIAKINEINRVPNGMSSSFQGAAQVFQSALSSMIVLFGLAIIVIYIVLGILYESFYHPFTILSAIPLAAFGALLTLLIFNAELTIYAWIGIIMLVGLVKKNGIIMIDFALEAQRNEGKSAADAIHEACMVRFRPIMMTTMAALMAGLPIAFGYGAGAESRRPLGLAVVGGLLFSQTLTLYVTPVFFVYMEKLRVWLHGETQPEEAPLLPPVEPVEEPAAGE